MKEVCIINYASNAAIYGIGTYIREYIRCLTRMGCRVNLIELGLDENNHEIYVTEKGLTRTIYIPYVSRGSMNTYNKCVCRLLRLYLVDSVELIFHFHYLQSSSLFMHIKKYFPLSKSVLTVHYLYWSARFNGNLTAYENVIKKKNRENIKKKYKDVVENYQQEKDFISAVDKTVCLALDTYKLLNGLYEIKKEKLFVAPNGLIQEKKMLSTEMMKKELRRKYHIQDNEKLIIFVGRINSIKGVYPLLSCFDKIVNKYPNCRMILIGDGNISDVIKYAQEAVCKVTFIGRLDKKKLYQWYSIADIAVFPSYYEECSYVGIEMLMHGIPIVASDGYAVRNMFNNNNAIIAPIKNWDRSNIFEDNLVNGIFALLESDELSNNKRSQALQEYHRIYQLKCMQKKYVELFTAL